jgi:hypothetical protein
MLTTVMPESTALVRRLRQRAQSELAVVGDFSLRVVVAEQERKPRPRAGSRVAHHGKVAIELPNANEDLRPMCRPMPTRVATAA